MSHQKRTILIVEDEESITTPLAEALERDGFNAEIAHTVADALGRGRTLRPDLVLLDIGLPDGSGLDVCRELRSSSNVPIIILSARGEEADRVVGLELGADDYVVKPFSAREVIARIRAVLRRASAPTGAAEGPIEVGDVRLDPSRRTASLDGEPLELARKEFDLLALLMQEAGTVVSARAADRRGLGRELVRLDEDPRRARERAPQEARRRRRRLALHPHRARRRLPLRLARGAPLSLRLRLLAAFAYVLVLVLIVLEIPLVLSLSSRVNAEVKSQAAAQAQVVATAAAAQGGDPARLRQLVRQAGRDLGARVIVVDARGRLVADSAGTGLSLTSYRNRPEIAAALAGRSEQGTRHSDTLGSDLLYTAVPVLGGGAVRVTQSVDAVGARVRRNVLVVIGVGLVALALGLALAWVVAGSLARPLRALARTARRVEDGELDARADITGASEQREVAIAFNDMTERLEESIQAQREFVGNASHQLRTPLTGLRLRLEAAEIKADDPAVEHELRLAEAEVERLTNLLNSLLTLARGGDRPVVRGARLAARCVGGGSRALAPARRGDRAYARARRRGRRAGAGRGGGRGDRARQPDRERPRLRAARNHRDDLVERGRTPSPSSTRARASRRARRSRSSSASAAGGATGRARAWGSRSSRRSPGAGEALRRSGTARPAAPARRCGCPSTARPATWSRSR